MYQSVIYFVCFLSLLFTFVLLVKNQYRDLNFSNFLFTLITGITGIWIVLLWLADTSNSTGVARVCLNLGVLCVNVLTWVFLFFALSYPNRPISKYRALITTSVLVNLVFVWYAVSQRIVTDVSLSNFGASIVNATSLYGFHVIQTNALIILGIVILNIRKSSMEDSEKHGVNLMTSAIVVAVGGSLLSGTLASYVKGLEWLNIVGSVSIVLFVIIIGYTIIKHKLFNVKAVLARSTAYLLSLGLIVFIASIILFFITDIFEARGVSRSYQQVFYILVTLVLAISYQPVKKTFDKLTNKLFYKDAYDTQEFLDLFNKTIVSTIELHKLLEESSHTIKLYLKTDYCSFIVNQNNELRVFGDDNLPKPDLENIYAAIQKSKRKVLINERLSAKEINLKNALDAGNLNLAVKLTHKSHPDILGFLVLGVKKSGENYSGQDIGVLNIVANELVIAIQNALRFEEIQQFNVTLQQKVSEATRQLRATNDKLKALDQTKDEFISMASHQLRTPLTSVKGYVSMVLEGDAGKITKQQRALLDQAFLSSQRMVYLIADLLNVSRLRTGKFVIESKPTQLADVIEGEIQQLQESAKAKNMTLTYHRPKAFPMLNLDETKIRQVIMNFADNALYYTPAGGNIDIYLEDKGQTIEFRVEDNGIGVPKNEQHHLFSKFYRAGNAQKARPDGTGLGLFMAKKVVVAQGGAILFRSQEGKGSMFGFSFPKKVLLANLKTPE